MSSRPEISMDPMAASSTGRVVVFVSFDTEHDASLYEVLLAQSRETASVFTVSGGSERPTAAEAWSQRARRRIAVADQVIVICGEHTEASVGVFAELRIAQQQDIVRLRIQLLAEQIVPEGKLLAIGDALRHECIGQQTRGEFPRQLHGWLSADVFNLFEACFLQEDSEHAGEQTLAGLWAAQRLGDVWLLPKTLQDGGR